MIDEHQLEIRVKHLAAAVEYPPTPDLAARLPPVEPAPARRLGRSSPSRRVASARSARRLVWAALALLVIVAAASAAPPVRAALVEVFRLGAVQVRLGEPTPAAGSREVVLPGETTLEAARAASRVHIPLPQALGTPDRVFLVTAVANTVVLTWEQEGLALYVIPFGAMVEKLSPQNVQQAVVNGSPALWASGDHFLELVEGHPEKRVFVTSHVLIWTSGSVTYRLETDGSLSEAIEIAESLK